MPDPVIHMPLSGRVASRVLREVLAHDIAEGTVSCLRGVAADGSLIDLDYGGSVREISRAVVTFSNGTQVNGMDAVFTADEIGACRVSELRALVMGRST